VNKQSEHLSDAQIENYGSQTSGAEPDAAQSAEDQRINAHLNDCASCRNLLLEFHRNNFGILLEPRQLADLQVNTASTPDCGSEDALRQLAADMSCGASVDSSPNSPAAKLTLHAATCDRCGPLLKRYTDICSDDFSPEEQAVLDSLQSSSAAWQQQTARKMLAAAGAQTAPADFPAKTRRIAEPLTTSVRKSFFWKWALIPATAAICGLIAFSIWYTQRDTPEKVEKLLAQAYTDQRTMEMRVPGAAHADFKQTRSGESASLLNAPESLRKAASKVSTQLSKTPDNPGWLLLSARLNLLEWQYKAAMTALEKVGDEKVRTSPNFLLTRSLALYEQAEFEPEQRDLNYGEIINLLGQVLQKTPDDTIALFNRATACEKLRMYECASADYERVVKIEKDSGLSADASEHLRRIKEKKNLEH
jgi:tetratricopeptide (TPR) repeat protein